MSNIIYHYQTETGDELAQLSRIAHGTVALRAAELGHANGEPLLVCLDSLLRYAKAHVKRHESPLAEDYVLGPAFLEAIKGVRALLNGCGAVAMERDISTDSFDGGMLESLFWHAFNVAGFKDPEDL